MPPGVWIITDDLFFLRLSDDSRIFPRVQGEGVATPGKPRNSTENSPRNSTRKLRFNTLNGLREEGYSLPEGSQGGQGNKRRKVTVHAPSRGGIIASQCSNLRSPMLNSLREWGKRRSTRVFREKPAKNASNFEGICTVTRKS